MATIPRDTLRLRSGEAVDAQGIMTDRDFQFLIASLLVRIAKTDGTISTAETSQMLAITESHFRLSSAEALELLTNALTEAPEPEELEAQLRALRNLLDPSEKEEVAILMLELIAADGRRESAELDVLHYAAEVLEIPPEVMHSAYERFFEK
ncbi:tellurite resistance TerB family protein [Lentisalinibacter salinarum]|uniref:tellurite resistance TerB family protein n=1 Tax=Lentisalinibacter salinarum TaxID=2992239 RepID=UPI0038681251